MSVLSPKYAIDWIDLSNQGWNNRDSNPVSDGPFRYSRMKTSPDGDWQNPQHVNQHIGWNRSEESRGSVRVKTTSRHPVKQHMAGAHILEASVPDHPTDPRIQKAEQSVISYSDRNDVTNKKEEMHNTVVASSQKNINKFISNTGQDGRSALIIMFENVSANKIEREENPDYEDGGSAVELKTEDKRAMSDILMKYMGNEDTYDTADLEDEMSKEIVSRGLYNDEDVDITLDERRSMINPDEHQYMMSRKSPEEKRKQHVRERKAAVNDNADSMSSQIVSDILGKTADRVDVLSTVLSDPNMEVKPGIAKQIAKDMSKGFFQNRVSPEMMGKVSDLASQSCPT